MNDPNGPIVWGGQTHLFYQVNPHGADWATGHGFTLTVAGKDALT